MAEFSTFGAQTTNGYSTFGEQTTSEAIHGGGPMAKTRAEKRRRRVIRNKVLWNRGLIRYTKDSNDAEEEKKPNDETGNNA